MSTVVQIVGDNTTVFETTDDQAIVSSQVTGLQGPQGIQGATGATGATGAQGPSGVIAVTSPITNSGTSTSAQLGFDQTAQNTTNDGRYARLASANAFTVGGHTITNDTDVVPLTLRGNSVSQTNNLFEILRADGGSMFRIRSGGNFGLGTLVTGVAAAINNSFTSAATPVLIIRGAVSQSANLEEWQNSGATAVATMSSGGVFRATSVNTLTDYVGLREANSGGFLRMTRQTAASANIAANVASLYFRDGTTAGTLKLVVRAGASGAETTILDNIPQ